MNQYYDIYKDKSSVELMDICQFHRDEYKPEVIDAVSQILRERESGGESMNSVKKECFDEYLDGVESGCGDLNLSEGIGFMLRGHFRETTKTYVAYRFFCLFYFPIFPSGAYRISDAGPGNYADFQKTYNVYGKVASVKKEILFIYILWYGFLALAAFALFMLHVIFW